MISFGKVLKELREEKGLKQKDLAVILNVSDKAISSWELGRTEPSMEIIVAIAKFFGVTTDYLLGLEN